jgi:hypothetical protein
LNPRGLLHSGSHGAFWVACCPLEPPWLRGPLPSRRYVAETAVGIGGTSAWRICGLGPAPPGAVKRPLAFYI